MHSTSSSITDHWSQPDPPQKQASHPSLKLSPRIGPVLTTQSLHLAAQPPTSPPEAALDIRYWNDIAGLRRAGKVGPRSMHEEKLVARVTQYVLAVWAGSTLNLDAGTTRCARPKFFRARAPRVETTSHQVRVLRDDSVKVRRSGGSVRGTRDAQRRLGSVIILCGRAVPPLCRPASPRDD